MICIKPVAMTLINFKSLCHALLACSIGWTAAPTWAQEAPQQLPTVTLSAGMFNIKAQLAQTPQQRQIGLMHRRDMPANDGMLFVFEAPTVQCFWMKNTLLPLSIAFLADDGRIVNMTDMKPLDETSHCSDQPVRYVLEMNKCWFDKRGLRPGSKIAGPGFKP
jgi:uncharacterized protein